MSEKPVAVTVTIFREVFTLHGSGDPESMRRLAGYIDSKMRELARKLPTAPYQRLAVLTALNLAAELFEGKQDFSDIREDLDHLDQASRTLLELLQDSNNSLGPSDGI
jgi:cell division protein ZapA